MRPWGLTLSTRLFIHSLQLCERGFKVDSFKYCYPEERPYVRL